jgi:DNA-binding transcriptional MerR regulator
VADPGLLRIGELSRRSGVSPALLRAWERRYGLLRPARSAGGLRLYSADDLARVEQMQQQLAAGVAAAEAAALAVRAKEEEDVTPVPAHARRELQAAFARFDEAETHAVIDSLLAQVSVDTLLAEVVLPYLHDLGERWARGRATIAEEHFACSVLRGRMLGLARGWGRGIGPVALLACAPGELHDLGLIAFGLALRQRAWRVVFLGADTPLESVSEAARAFDPAVVVISSVGHRSFRRHRDELLKLAGDHLVRLGGAGAPDALPNTDLVALAGSPVEEADRLSEPAVR